MSITIERYNEIAGMDASQRSKISKDDLFDFMEMTIARNKKMEGMTKKIAELSDANMLKAIARETAKKEIDILNNAVQVARMMNKIAELTKAIAEIKSAMNGSDYSEGRKYFAENEESVLSELRKRKNERIARSKNAKDERVALANRGLSIMQELQAELDDLKK